MVAESLGGPGQWTIIAMRRSPVTETQDYWVDDLLSAEWLCDDEPLSAEWEAGDGNESGWLADTEEHVSWEDNTSDSSLEGS